MSGEHALFAATFSEQVKVPIHIEKGAGSPVMDDIAAKLYARMERKNVGTAKGMWKRKERKSKDWNLCWDFQSKHGCRKGAQCKWLHNALLNSHNVHPWKKSHWKRQYYGATGPAFGYGGLGQQPGMGTHWLPHYGPMTAVGLNFAPKPSDSPLNIVAKIFSPNVEAKEFSPTPTKDTRSPGSTMNGKNVHAKEFSPISKGVPASCSKKGKNVVAEEFSPGGKSSYSLGALNSGKNQGEKCQNESQTVNRAPKNFTHDSQAPTSAIAKPCTLDSICENNPQNINDGVILDSICQNNPQNINDGANEANHGTPRSRTPKTPSFRILKSYSHWADACSPLHTPVFKKLPMPQITTLSPSIMADGDDKTETPRIKNSPKWSKSQETLKQLRQQLKNSSIAKGRGAAELKPVSHVPESFRFPRYHAGQTDLDDIPEHFSPKIRQYFARTGGNISNSVPSTEAKNPSLLMMNDPVDNNLLPVAKGHSKSQNLEADKTGSIQNSFDVRNVESSQDCGPITKNSTKEKTAMVDSVLNAPGYTGGVVADQESISFPSARHTNTSTGGLEGKNSKTTSQVKENLLQSSDKASTQVEALLEKTPTSASSVVFSPPLQAPAVLPPQGNKRRSYGGRARGKSGGKYRMNSNQSGRGRGTKDGQGSYDENQIQSKLPRFPKRGENSSTRGKSSRGRRQRGVGRGGKPRVFRS